MAINTYSFVACSGPPCLHALTYGDAISTIGAQVTRGLTATHHPIEDRNGARLVVVALHGEQGVASVLEFPMLGWSA